MPSKHWPSMSKSYIVRISRQRKMSTIFAFFAYAFIINAIGSFSLSQSISFVGHDFFPLRANNFHVPYLYIRAEHLKLVLPVRA